MSGRRGLNLSAAQVIASVLATLSAAVAASFLGVAGTLLGAALGSVVSTMGTEIYKHYLQRSEERLRSAGQVLYHSAAKTGTGTTNAQAGAASGGRHAADQDAAGQQGATRQLGNREVAGQDPANQDTAVWDRRQYGTPRDPHETQTMPGSGTEWAGAAYGGVTNGGSPSGGVANGGSPNGWNGSADSAGQHANGSITPEGADGDAAGLGGVWAAITSFFAGLTRRQWLTYGGIAAGFFIVVIGGIIVFQLAVGRPVLGSPVGPASRQQQRQTRHPSSTPSATPTGSTPASPTSSASQTSGTPTPTSGTPTPGTSGTASSPSTVPSPTPSTGSTGAARTSSLATPAP
jgi:hypothetical protein